MTTIEPDARMELMAYLRPYYARQKAPIAPAIWTGAPTKTSSAECPICGKMGRMAMLLEDVTGTCWGLVADCACGIGTGGIVATESPSVQVRPGPVRPSYRHGQGALDRRYERLVAVMNILPSVAVSADTELMNELEGPDAPVRDWLGGGLSSYADTLLDHPEFDWWQIGKCWETLCVLDGERASRAIGLDETCDALLAAVDRQTRTGIWCLHGLPLE